MKKLSVVVFDESGYYGDDLPYPDYKKICIGDTGYLEVVRVIFDTTSKSSLQQIFKYFFLKSMILNKLIVKDLILVSNINLLFSTMI